MKTWILGKSVEGSYNASGDSAAIGVSLFCSTSLISVIRQNAQFERALQLLADLNESFFAVWIELALFRDFASRHCELHWAD